MKKFILCIIISCLFSSQQFLHAQETVLFGLKTTDQLYSNEASYKNIDVTLWNASDIAMHRINHDFYKREALNTIAFRSTKRNHLPTATNDRSEKSINSANFVPPNNSELIALQKPCVPFIIAIFSLLVMVIAFIVVRRIKTNTLKLF
ncbi:hypothetical protein IMCC3317_10420 [Kordia antarctica]|uniref:Uncharacterized protein n=1 Tax=Kordia antarctica TaxID=1218801 RepID=A0A7L4ZGD1_9FLAO|nr:hypothetical protein [Kordia antarctica]QHI35695.1 hypothetical protein IMCC3317_10420 [Kordia antarctica]